MKDKNDIGTRLTELQVERERLMGELENARIEARDALIAGQKPAGTATALAERISIVDDVIAELEDQTHSIAERTERNNRRRRAESALDATAKRTKLAASVDKALVALAANWNAYVEALRIDVGQVSGAGGDLTC